MKKLIPSLKAVCALGALSLSLGSFNVFANDITATELPQEVQKTVHDQFPNAKIISAQTDTDHGVIQYKVKIQDGDQMKEVSLGSDGSVLQIENS